MGDETMTILEMARRYNLQVRFFRGGEWSASRWWNGRSFGGGDHDADCPFTALVADYPVLQQRLAAGEAEGVLPCGLRFRLNPSTVAFAERMAADPHVAP